MDGLVVGGEVIPEHGGVLKVGLRIAFLGVDEDGEFSRVAQEENRGVVEHPIPVSLLGVELHGESARVTGTVRGSLLTTNGREAGEHLGLLADTLEHINDSLCIISLVVLRGIVEVAQLVHTRSLISSVTSNSP